jgi:hypothetical protein
MKGEANDSGGLTLLIKTFTKAFSRCPICDEGFVDHYFTLLSVIPTWKVELVKELLDKVKHYEWAAAREHRDFDPLQDAIQVYVLRCPGKRMAVVTVSDPYEPYHNATVLDYEVLDYERSQDLRTVMAEAEWLRIE